MDKRLFSESELTELESIEILGGIDPKVGGTFGHCVIQVECTNNACTHTSCTYGNCSHANCEPEVGCSKVDDKCGGTQTPCSATHDNCPK